MSTSPDETTMIKVMLSRSRAQINVQDTHTLGAWCMCGDVISWLAFISYKKLAE